MGHAFDIISEKYFLIKIDNFFPMFYFLFYRFHNFRCLCLFYPFYINVYISCILWIQFSSVQLLSVSDSLRPHKVQHSRPPCRSPTPRVYPNSCPLSRWCHTAISFSAVPFSCHLQSLPASGSFQISQFFTSDGQSIGVSASASVLPMNTQDWSPLAWTGWISLQSKGLSRVFNIIV